MDVRTLSCHPTCHSWHVKTSWGSTTWGRRTQEAEIGSGLRPGHSSAVELPKAEPVEGGWVQGACVQLVYSGTSEKQSNCTQTGRHPGMARANHGLSCFFSSNQEGENQPQLPAQPAVILSSTVARETEAGRGYRAQAFSSWKSQAGLWSAWQDPGTPRGSEKYKAKKNVPG